MVARYLVREQMCLLLSNGWEFGETLGIRVVPTTVSNSILAWALQETKSWSSFLKISTFFLHSLPLSHLLCALLFRNFGSGLWQRGAPGWVGGGAPLWQCPHQRFKTAKHRGKGKRGRECRKNVEIFKKLDQFLVS